MIRRCVTAACAVIISISMITISYAGASCCDPANALGGPQVASPAPGRALKPSTTGVPKGPGRQGMPAFMSYGQRQAIPLSNLAPGGNCCSNPNDSCAARTNAAGQPPLQGPGLGCSAGCCGGKSSAGQPTQAVGQFGAKPIRAVGPVPRERPMLTANPVKAQARPKPSELRNLW